MTTACLIGVAILCLSSALLYSVMKVVNLMVFRAPGTASLQTLPAISIPARDEIANIAEAIKHALTQYGTEVDVVVLDDISTDGTDQIVATYASADARVRLARGVALPPGRNGKQHACHQLAQFARHPVLLFFDADVRLEPDAALRMAGHLDLHGLAPVSGFPRQIVRTLGEIIAVPQIMVALPGYLPFPMARRSTDLQFAAGSGQLMMVRVDACARAGGHAAFRALTHDGMNLPRHIRHTGGRTDIIDATALASCRMYNNWPDLWSGFTKNATEGMARPRALPVWTILLGGGHVAPWLLMPLAWSVGAPVAAWMSALAIVAVMIARTALVTRVRQPVLSVVLHPIGVIVTLAIQWSALLGARRGHKARWRGRSYDFQ